MTLMRRAERLTAALSELEQGDTDPRVVEVLRLLAEPVFEEASASAYGA